MYRMRVQIKGVVQGVGFRPFVHSLARQFNLNGWVINDSSGVEIEVDGSRENLDRFLDAITRESPPLAQIVEIGTSFSEISDGDAFKSFEIRHSVYSDGERVLISPDVAVCRDCIREMYDPDDHRYRYPFLNCTNCGPRFTIIEDIPYDRPKTVMREFPMCEKCLAEYSNPSDRRFHAQPTCCPDCGPTLQFLDENGNETIGDPIENTIRKLLDGKIVAIKGIGGFHLACDAMNNQAVKRLRERKHREARPLAVMVGGISSARRIAVINEDGEKALCSPARPIVIVNENPESPISGGDVYSVTGGVRTIGIMLPYAPLHHLLFRPLPVAQPDNPSKITIPEEIGGSSNPESDTFHALVMTSGNLSDEPIAFDNTEAIERLKGIADGFLLNNRKIHRRADDSVAAIRDGVTTIWRWGRGHVPRPIFLPESLPGVLGVGPELKNTICHIRDDKAFLSPHIGDLKTYDTYEYLRETIEHQSRILDVNPECVACDLHPDYQSTRWAEEESGLPVIKVQHHHAHTVALMAEHGILDREILALAMDGTGLGTDGAIWGGEILRATVTEFSRLGHFTYAPLPGGDTAVKEVWRSALGRLYRDGSGLDEKFRPLFDGIPPDQVAMVESMIKVDVNCPKVCSLGRLFDVAAFIAGIGHSAQFDGQFPMLLEAACDGHIDLVDRVGQKIFSLADELVKIVDGNVLIDGNEIISALCEMRLKKSSTRDIARFTHRLVVIALEKASICARSETGLETIGLTGGCFMNRLLHEGLKSRLERAGFEVLTHRLIPANDGGISLGQAVCAGYKIKDRIK